MGYGERRRRRRASPGPRASHPPRRRSAGRPGRRAARGCAACVGHRAAAIGTAEPWATAAGTSRTTGCARRRRTRDGPRAVEGGSGGSDAAVGAAGGDATARGADSAPTRPRRRRRPDRRRNPRPFVQLHAPPPPGSSTASPRESVDPRVLLRSRSSSDRRRRRRRPRRPTHRPVRTNLPARLIAAIFHRCRTPPDANVTALADPRGVWHSDVSPPAPWYPTIPPAPFPPFPGVPPFPLFLYAKLQAVPRCSRILATRARRRRACPRGTGIVALRAAEAARTQWAQMVDLAQIQVGGSHGTSGEMWQYGAAEASDRERNGGGGGGGGWVGGAEAVQAAAAEATRRGEKVRRRYVGVWRDAESLAGLISHRRLAQTAGPTPRAHGALPSGPPERFARSRGRRAVASPAAPSAPPPPPPAHATLARDDPSGTAVTSSTDRARRRRRRRRRPRRGRRGTRGRRGRGTEVRRGATGRTRGNRRLRRGRRRRVRVRGGDAAGGSRRRR